MKTDDRYVLGLDMGTSTVKAALFAPDGARVGLQAEEYLLTPDSQIVEADPEMYWSPVVRATRRLLEEFKGRPEQIAAVSTSTFGESIFPMAADKTPARPSISWLDNRSSEEARDHRACRCSRDPIDQRPGRYRTDLARHQVPMDGAP